MKIAIIGGAGRMGRWLTRYFTSHGHKITISDIHLDKAKIFAESANVELAHNNFEAAKSADLIVISTPLKITPTVIKEITRYVTKDSIITEICSIKSEVIRVMREIAKLGVRPLSIHPLFGPGARSLQDRRIAIVPVINSKAEVDLAQDLFPEAELVAVEAEEHDRAIAVTLSLVYFLNSVFSWVLSEKDLVFLRKLAGTTFRMQLVLAESIMAEEPTLNTSIQLGNQYAPEILEDFLSKARILKDWITERNTKDFLVLHERIETILNQDPDFSKAYSNMYKILDNL
jgi:prephenate dehydrogenase